MGLSAGQARTTETEREVWFAAVENEEHLVYLSAAFPSDEDLVLTDSS